MINYWGIRIQTDETKGSMLLQQDRDEMHLSPHVRLAGMSKMAHIDSEEMAEAFLAASTPVLNKRYGIGYRAAVVEWSGSDTRQLREQIYCDSAIVRARLKTGNFAPNRAVVPQED